MSLITETNGVAYKPYTDPSGGHPYVEIGGIKWATMNVGANSITDTGLLFQWGDTQGYTAAQVGVDKTFNWANYKYWTADDGSGSSGMTKYNSTDGKTVLDLSDDAARANWGGGWRMPTEVEFRALSAATTAVRTANYEGSGVAGLVVTSKYDSSKKLFFPKAGAATNDNFYSGGGCYLGSSLSSSNVLKAYLLHFDDYGTYWENNGFRYSGYSVRGVLVEN